MQAFLFTDIEGSTTRWERFAPFMGPALARHDAVLARSIAAHGGAIFKGAGDGVCAAFADVSAAAAAAAVAQAQLRDEDFSAVAGLAVRMAIHAGEAEARAGDYFGPALNLVARLADIGHGGQILLSGTAADMVRGILPAGMKLLDLGPHRLKDLARPEPVFQLAGGGLPEGFAALRSLEFEQHNLPRQATSFIGRETELAELAVLLRGHRLVTLLGAGGVGKTRLAVQAGAASLGGMQDGVRLLELAPLSETAQLAEAAATMLSAGIGGPDVGAAAVANFLKTRRMLLILDNCEHVIAGAAALADAILRQAPGVLILATSREPLGVPGEKIYRMPSLTFPDRAAGLTAAAALEYGAVRLFAERAALVSDRFEVTDETAPFIGEICQRLDGIALAIELAASRSKMLRPKDLLARLNDRFQVLNRGSRTALPRHQTLKAMIDWSYDLLLPDEQTVLRRLSVFAAGFTIAAAADVTAGGAIAPENMFDLVAGLVDKSMVSPLPDTGGDSRYRLLETTRQYAAAKLEAAGEGETMQRRFVEAMSRIYRQGRREWMTTPTEDWRLVYDQDADNVRAALAWAFAPGGDAAAGVRLLHYVLPLLEEMFVRPERLRWLDTATRRMTAETPPHIEAQIYLAIARVRFEEDGTAPALRALTLSQALGDRDSAAQAATIAAIGLVDHDPAAARDHAAMAHALVPQVRMTKLRGWVLGGLALVSMAQQDTEGAAALIAEALTIARRFGDRYLIHFCGLNLAEFECRQGDAAGAMARAREVEASCRRYGDRLRLASVLTNMTGYAIELGHLAEARAAGQEALRMHADNGDEEWFAVAAAHLALLAAHTEKSLSAARLAGFAARRRQKRPPAHRHTEQNCWVQLNKVLQQDLPRQALQAAMEEGATYHRDAAMNCAMTV